MVGLNHGVLPWPFWVKGRHPILRESQETGGGICRDLSVVPGDHRSSSTFGGAVVLPGANELPCSLCLGIRSLLGRHHSG